MKTTTCNKTSLAVTVDALRGTLRDLCADGTDAASQAKLMQPVLSKLCAVTTLQYERLTHTQNSALSLHDLRQIGAEVAVLAAEVRFMLGNLCPADKHVALATYDFQTLAGEQPLALTLFPAVANSGNMKYVLLIFSIECDAGGDSCAILELLLNDFQRYVVHNDQEDTLKV